MMFAMTFPRLCCRPAARRATGAIAPQIYTRNGHTHVAIKQHPAKIMGFRAVFRGIAVRSRDEALAKSGAGRSAHTEPRISQALNPGYELLEPLLRLFVVAVGEEDGDCN